MITNFFIPELNNHDVQEVWFQQDGATNHTARATIDLLKDTFGDRLISRFGPVNWSPRSCDLTPLYYFLWVIPELWRTSSTCPPSPQITVCKQMITPFTTESSSSGWMQVHGILQLHQSRWTTTINSGINITPEPKVNRK
ncbi:putative LOC100569746 [Trichonephila clavipes]|nr:putative LOC100569746 [Trichonephila clavipes]